MFWRPVNTFCLTLGMITFLCGCGDKAVYHPSIAELNQKAKTLMEQGNTEGALARLEAARDLNPNEPNTLYNLAIAYQAKERYDESIEILERLAKTKDSNQGNHYRALGMAYEEKAAQAHAQTEEAKEKHKPVGEIQKLHETSGYYYNKAQQAYQQSLESLQSSQGEAAEQLQLKINEIQKELQK